MLLKTLCTEASHPLLGSILLNKHCCGLPDTTFNFQLWERRALIILLMPKGVFGSVSDDDPHNKPCILPWLPSKSSFYGENYLF